jgi:hypothetical protein
MSKYTTTKNEFSIDVTRKSDNHACGFMCSRVFWEGDDLYADAVLYKEGDNIPEGKKFGDVRQAGRGWVQEDLNWDDELQRVFGEVDADLKKELTDYFTSDMKAKYLAFQKGE